MTKVRKNPDHLRSRQWFDNPDDPEMTALYLEKYINFGLTWEELRSKKPIIGIAQTGSDLSPCNRHHLELTKRVRDGITAAGGTPLEIPVHPIQETGKRPTAMLDRNLTYLGLVEALYGYPIDAVVLNIGCDKTTPALLMAAATVNIPAIALSVGPMLNGWLNGQRTGSGTIVWKARQLLAAGEINEDQFLEMAAASVPSVGYCNTMGTASTMNSLAEALGMQLPGSAAIPAPLRERGQFSYQTGRRIVEMVWEDLKPSDIMTKGAFLNAIAVCSALGGSTNAPIHLNAIARHIGVDLTNDDWQENGYDVPLLVNLQPAGEYLSEDFFRAGGVPAVAGTLLEAGLVPDPKAIGCNGKSFDSNYRGTSSKNDDVIRPVANPLKAKAGFLNLKGNLFNSAIMKTSVVTADFHKTYFENPDDPEAFEGEVLVFDGPEDFHKRIDDPELKASVNTVLVMRGAGPIGYPGGAEVVNMRPPAYLIRKGINALPCIGDGRQSGTSGSPSILNASPEAAAGGGLAILEDGDRIRIDLKNCTVNVLLSDEELEARHKRLREAGGYTCPVNATPWQKIFRENVTQFEDGMVLEGAPEFRAVGCGPVPRNNH
ncbi:IlvD/Edd family dehydratase [Roseibium sp.]|uniref:IlvD/Edd family dehydratase n=1 Tax=Roseibium sp. TaxID=1936156 RepID=UPI003A9871A4